MPETKPALTPETMKRGGRYNFKNQQDRLIYLGRNWSGNGFWHQFRKIGDLRKVWAEVRDDELDLLEESDAGDSLNLIRVSRMQAWERAKGELNAMLCTFFGESGARAGQFEQLDDAIKSFVSQVEDDRLAE